MVKHHPKYVSLSVAMAWVFHTEPDGVKTPMQLCIKASTDGGCLVANDAAGNKRRFYHHRRQLVSRRYQTWRENQINECLFAGFGGQKWAEWCFMVGEGRLQTGIPLSVSVGLISLTIGLLTNEQ